MALIEIDGWPIYFYGPSIPWQTVSHNQRVYIYLYIYVIYKMLIYIHSMLYLSWYIYNIYKMLDIYIYTCSDTPLQDIASLRHPSARKSGSPPLTVRNFRFRHGTRRVCCLCFVGTREKHGGTQPMARLMWSLLIFSIFVLIWLDLGAEDGGFPWIASTGYCKTLKHSNLLKRTGPKISFHCHGMQADFSSFVGYYTSDISILVCSFSCS